MGNAITSLTGEEEQPADGRAPPGAPAAGGAQPRQSEEPKAKDHRIDENRFSTSMTGHLSISGRFHRAPKSLEEDYKVESDVLGTGMNGSVFQATRLHNPSQKFAIKEFKTVGIAAAKLQELETECQIFLAMDHPHVARLVDVYETKDKLTLVMEKMGGGELFDRVIAKKRFCEKDALGASYQMLLAINYVHSHKVVHRDIKLENWLYDEPGSDHLKLIDFGFSKVRGDPNEKMKMSCGTLSYVAPEVLRKNYTSQCDMWSLGVVVFILLGGYMPFSGSDDKQVKDIKSGNFKFKPEKWNTVSASARDFVEKLMKVDADERLSAEKALEHTWIVNRAQVSDDLADKPINQDVVNSMYLFAQESKFRRACMLAMAWSLGNEERAKVRGAFEAMDKNHKGTITLTEFKQVLEENFHLDDAEVKRCFEALDAAHNNEIQYSEFLASMVSSRIALHDDHLHTAFRRFDTDNTGYIDAANLKSVFGDEYSDKDISEMMNEVDENHDGKISYTEFIDYVQGTGAKDHHQEACHKIIDQETRSGPQRSKSLKAKD